MTISDKTRKDLWGASGRRCAYCRARVVAQATLDSESVLIGEECHIRSAKPSGPRYNPGYPTDALDGIENLIVLCRNDHKLVDTDTEVFTVERLIELKQSHETWVDRHLSFQVKAKDDPAYLTRIVSGKDLLGLLSHHHGFRLSHDEPGSAEEAELLADFAQNIQDWGDISGDLDAGAAIRAGYSLSEEIDRLDAAGFWFCWYDRKGNLSACRSDAVARDDHRRPTDDQPDNHFSRFRR